MEDHEAAPVPSGRRLEDHTEAAAVHERDPGEIEEEGLASSGLAKGLGEVAGGGHVELALELEALVDRFDLQLHVVTSPVPGEAPDTCQTSDTCCPTTVRRARRSGNSYSEATPGSGR